MGEDSKKVAEFLERFGSKIFFLLFILELFITSFLWITKKISIELGFGNIFLLNIYALLPYIINLSIKRKEPNKREYVLIIDFYLSAVFWGISRMMDFSEFNTQSYNFTLFYLGFLTSIIYFLPNPKPKRDSRISIIRFVLSIIMVLLSILILIWALFAPPTLLSLVPVELHLFYLIFYLILIVILLLLMFKPETEKEAV